MTSDGMTSLQPATPAYFQGSERRELAASLCVHCRHVSSRGGEAYETAVLALSWGCGHLMESGGVGVSATPPLDTPPQNMTHQRKGLSGAQNISEEEYGESEYI